MNIDIHRPELEALIQHRLDSGQFETVEDLLFDALSNAQQPSATASISGKPNLAQFLLDSPLPGSGLVLERINDAPRVVEL
jgi:hypothetical protein